MVAHAMGSDDGNRAGQTVVETSQRCMGELDECGVPLAHFVRAALSSSNGVGPSSGLVAVRAASAANHLTDSTVVTTESRAPSEPQQLSRFRWSAARLPDTAACGSGIGFPKPWANHHRRLLPHEKRSYPIKLPSICLFLPPDYANPMLCT